MITVFLLTGASHLLTSILQLLYFHESFGFILYLLEELRILYESLCWEVPMKSYLSPLTTLDVIVRTGIRAGFTHRSGRAFTRAGVNIVLGVTAREGRVCGLRDVRIERRQ